MHTLYGTLMAYRPAASSLGVMHWMNVMAAKKVAISLQKRTKKYHMVCPVMI